MVRLATAEVLHHLIAIPFAGLGMLLVLFPGGLATLYANIFGALGFKRFADMYSGDRGPRLVRVFGFACFGIGAC